MSVHHLQATASCRIALASALYTGIRRYPFNRYSAATTSSRERRDDERDTRDLNRRQRLAKQCENSEAAPRILSADGPRQRARARRPQPHCVLPQ